MGEPVFVPKLGQTVEEVTLGKWLVPDGTKVERGQEILEVETDKAVFTVEAPARGYLHIDLQFAEHAVVPVLAVVGIIGGQHEGFGTAAAALAQSLPNQNVADAPEVPVAEATDREHIFASPRAAGWPAKRDVDLARVKASGAGGARIVESDVIAYLGQVPRATPVAQRVAVEAGLDLRQVPGSGLRGTITRGDVERARGATPAPAMTLSEERARDAMPEIVGMPPVEADVLERVPLAGVRKVIAERMAASAHTTARVTLVTEADATELVVIRERLKAALAGSWGFAPGYNDMLARIVAVSLHKHPYMNARITGEAIERLAHVNLGMAVDTERGLLVPVIRDADRKPVHQFAVEFRALVERAVLGGHCPTISPAAPSPSPTWVCTTSMRSHRLSTCLKRLSWASDGSWIKSCLTWARLQCESGLP